MRVLACAVLSTRELLVDLKCGASRNGQGGQARRAMAHSDSDVHGSAAV